MGSNGRNLPIIVNKLNRKSQLLKRELWKLPIRKYEVHLSYKNDIIKLDLQGLISRKLFQVSLIY